MSWRREWMCDMWRGCPANIEAAIKQEAGIGIR
jgi:hypothetical protein